jgi:hypothetical protein
MADQLKSLDQKRTDLTPGTLLVREWNRRSHRVMVVAGGFAWNGQTYDSLTKIARADSRCSRTDTKTCMASRGAGAN